MRPLRSWFPALPLLRRMRAHAARSLRLKLAAILGVIGLVAWTQLFLGVHELSHLGQRDASACRFALVASTAGSGDTPATVVLFVPIIAAPQFLSVVERAQVGVSFTQQARAPPVLA